MRMIFNLRVHPFSVSQDDSLCAFIAVIPKYGTPCPSKPINVWNLKTLWKRRIPCSFLPFQGVFPWSKPPPKYIFLWPPKEDRNNKTRPPRPAVTCGVTWNSGGLPQLENVLPNRWEQSSSPFPGPGSEIYFFCDFYKYVAYFFCNILLSPGVNISPGTRTSKRKHRSLSKIDDSCAQFLLINRRSFRCPTRFFVTLSKRKEICEGLTMLGRRGRTSAKIFLSWSIFTSWPVVTIFPRSLLRHVTCQIEDFKRLFCKPSGRLLPNKTLPSKKNQPSLRVLFFFSLRHFKVRWHLYDVGSVCVCIPESSFDNPAGELLRNLNES